VVELDCGVGWKVGVDDDNANIVDLVFAKMVGLNKYHDRILRNGCLVCVVFGTGCRESGYSFR
jgi:hypothetical protein